MALLSLILLKILYLKIAHRVIILSYIDLSGDAPVIVSTTSVDNRYITLKPIN